MQNIWRRFIDHHSNTYYNGASNRNGDGGSNDLRQCVKSGVDKRGNGEEDGVGSVEDGAHSLVDGEGSPHVAWEYPHSAQHYGQKRP